MGFEGDDLVRCNVNVIQAYFDYDYNDHPWAMFQEYSNMPPSTRREIFSSFGISNEIMSKMKDPKNYNKNISEFILNLADIYNKKLKNCSQQFNKDYYNKAIDILDDLYYYVNNVINPKSLEEEDDLHEF